jgi:glycosyl hydrolase family 42 (putative beta-galactosidase)/VCBS repeat protein
MNVINNKTHLRSRLSAMSFLLGALFCAFSMTTEKAFSEVPRGVFCLLGDGEGIGQHSPIYSDPDVDGIGVRQKWADLEPAEGVYDWSYLDYVTARAAAAGKAVLLRIATGGGDTAVGGGCPTWVMDAVAAEPLPASQKFYTFTDNGRSVTIAVFWDPVWLAKKTAMITALGARYSSNPAVKIVGASFANATTEDWNVPHAPPQVAAWFAAGYTSARMLDAGRQIIDATMAAFPNQYVTLAVGTNGHTGHGPNLDPDANYVARNAVLNARASWPGRLIVQKDSLATFIPSAPGTGTVWELLWNSRPDVAGQMLYWCHGDTTYRVNDGVPIDPSTALVNSVNKGVAYGMKYIEIYRRDVLNLPAATHYAHTALTSVGRSLVADFDGDGHPDFVVQNAATHQTVIGYLDNNVIIGAAYGPTLPGGWALRGLADFNRDSHPDYALLIPSTQQTIIGYLSGPTVIGAAYGPPLPGGWELVAAADFNGDGYPDYVVYIPSTHQTVIGYLNNNVVVGAALGPTLPAGWDLMAVADFNRDGHVDYALFNSSTGQTLIGYLSGPTVIGAAFGPTVPSGWQLAAAADFNGDEGPDYLLYKASTRETAIWYLNNNVYADSANGPTLPVGWSLVGP